MIIARHRLSLIAPWLELTMSYLSMYISWVKTYDKKKRTQKRTIKFVWSCLGHIHRCLVIHNIKKEENKILELLMKIRWSWWWRRTTNIEGILALIYTKKKPKPLTEQGIHNKRKLKKTMHTCTIKKCKKII
jgi:hypothetical protein